MAASSRRGGIPAPLGGLGRPGWALRHPDVRVRGLLRFVYADRPPIAGPLTMQVVSGMKLQRMLSTRGPLTPTGSLSFSGHSKPTPPPKEPKAG